MVRKPLAAALLLLLPAAAGGPATQVPTLPAERGGQELVGTTLPVLEFDRRLAMQDDGGVEPAPAVTLYRWWTDGCRFCQASLPTVERLRQTYAARGLHVVGVYHPKPPRAVPDADVRRLARDLGYRGDLAVDETWSQLRNVYLDAPPGAAPRRATSISLLVDAEGTIRFVHPGPVYFASDDPRHARENADYEALREAIEAVLDG